MQPFNYINDNPLADANYYRFKLLSPNGEVKNSNIVFLMNDKISADVITTSPNPVSENSNLFYKTKQAGKINILVNDATGKLLSNKMYKVIAGKNNINLSLTTLNQGTYFVTIVNTTGYKKTIRFVKL